MSVGARENPSFEICVGLSSKKKGKRWSADHLIRGALTLRKCLEINLGWSYCADTIVVRFKV